MSDNRKKVIFRYNNKKFYGGNKLKALRRDNWICQVCGMTNQQHILFFGISIGVHHIDGKGRNNKEPNNNVENLMTMCLQCHIKHHKPFEKKQQYGTEKTRRIDFDNFYDDYGDEINEGD